MLGYTAGEVVNKITAADISAPGEVIACAKAFANTRVQIAGCATNCAYPRRFISTAQAQGGRPELGRPAC
jgi:hypothetical protein